MKKDSLPYYRWAVYVKEFPNSCWYNGSVFHTRKDARDVSRVWKETWYFKTKVCKIDVA